jgi:pilus assembly protein FimV
MYKVAQQLRPSDAVTVSQTMVAIQRANPQAFSGDNINQLKRGQVLRVPSESQIREVSAQEAAASIRQQSQEWRAAHAPAQPEKQALDAQQVDATAPQVAPKAAAPVAKPEMKLLAQTDKAGASAAGKEQGATKPADAKKLDENRVKAAAAKAEKDKLAAKVGTLDAKVKTNDQKLAVQNAKLAELQTKLKDQQARAEAAKAEAAKVAAAKVEADKQAAVKAAAAKAEADKLAAAKAEAAKTVPVPAVQPTATAEQLDALTSPDAVKPATAGTDVAPAVEAKPLPAPAPVAATPAPVEAEAESGVNPLLVGGGVLALLGGIAGFIWNKRRREKAEEEEALAELEGMDERLAEIGGSEEAADNFTFAGIDQDDRRTEESFSLPDDSFAAAVEPDVAVVQDRVLADPLEEVEQYLAFERFPQAAGFLSKAIAANPGRADLRLKLAEVYARLDDHSGFAEQLGWFEAQGDLDSLARAEELKASMSPAPVAASHKDEGMLEYEPSKPAAAKSDDDIASLEDLEMDFNASVSASSPVLQAVSNEDLGLDADFGLDVPAEPVSAATAADSGLSLDEELDFSFDSKPAEPAASTADDLSFDLDEVSFESTTPATSEQAATADFDMDFSLDDVSLDEPKLDLEASTSGIGMGEIELADFDVAPSAGKSEPEVDVSALADDDLSFSLDDLDVPAPEKAAAAESFDLEGDFSLDETPATDLSFDETMQADSGMNDAAADFDAALNLDAVPATVEPVATAPVADAAGMDDEFDFLADTDENATKLDLARAYIDMGDMEGARDILQEVLNEGNGSQKDEAKGLLAQVG